MNDIIKKIRTDLRLAMNGVVSSSMRDKGVDYKLNFGVDLPRIKGIAQKYEPNVELANELWRLDVRELKILSTLLYPLDEFTESDADRWANEIPNQEIREYLCRNLLQKLSYADKLVQKWTADADQLLRLTGYWLYVRLMLIEADVLKGIDIMPIIKQTLNDVHSDDNLLSIAALNVLKQVVRRNMKGADKIMEEMKEFSASDNPKEKEIYDDLQFELKIRA